MSPNITGGVRMASVLLRPHVVSFLDVVMGEDDPLLLVLGRTEQIDGLRRTLDN